MNTPLEIILEGIDIPCSEECQPCQPFAALLQRHVPIAQLWSDVVSFGTAHECSAAHQVRHLTRGNLVTVRGFCVHCQTDPLVVRKTFQELRVEVVKGTVDIDRFVHASPATDSLCRRHGKPRLQIHCFGDVPQICLLRTVKKIDLRLERRRPYVMPMRIVMDKNVPSLCIKADESFLGTSLFVANPCYGSSWVDSEAKILSEESSGTASYFLVQMRDKASGDDEWDLYDVLQGKPFQNNSGAYKILDSMVSSLGKLDFKKVMLFPPLFLKETPTPDSPDVALSQPQISTGVASPPPSTRDHGVNIDPASVQPIASPGRHVESEDCEDSDSSRPSRNEEVTYGNPNVRYVRDIRGQFDLRGVQNYHDVLNGFQPTSIPFLFASYPYLWESQYENGHYIDGNENDFKMQDLIEEISQGRDLFQSGRTIEDFRRIGYRNDALLSESCEALRLSCDVDSLDVVTTPWGGMAFRGPMSKIFSQYQLRYAESQEYLCRNNNFARFSESQLLFPGKYFLEKSISKVGRSFKDAPQYNDPLAIRVFDMSSSLSVNSLKVRALVPSGSVHCAVLGNAALLALFSSAVFGRPTESSSPGGDDRVALHKFFWYLLREFLIFIASMITSGACYPVTGSILPCCAIPASENSHRHDRKRGAHSSFDDGVSLEKDELSLVFYLSARFFAALEQLSELPVERCVFTNTTESLYECQESLLETVDDIKVRECLRSELGDQRCLRFFKENVWNDRIIAGGLLRLSTDEERRRGFALPYADSNRAALDSGEMVLEDLLLLSPTLFRCTEHGVKRNVSSSAKALSLKEQLQDEIQVNFLRDGIVDVAFSLQGPRNSGWAVTMPTKTIRESKLLVPVSCSHLSFREINGTFYSTTGFPEFGGFSTKKGHTGNIRTVLSVDEVRRVKCYSSKRRLEATRGSTIYDAAGRDLSRAIRDFPTVMCSWMNQRPTTEPLMRRRSLQEEEKRMDSFQAILHDIERRRQAVLASRDGFGIRVELTYAACKGNWSCLDDVYHMMSLQEKRRSMLKEEFEDHFRDNPAEWPWWLRVPSSSLMRQRDQCAYELSSCLMPVTILPCETFVHFGLEIETVLVKNAYSVYLQGRSYVTLSSLSVPKNENAFFSSLCRFLTYGSATKLSLVLVRALLAAAGVFLDTLTCKFQDLAFHMPPFVLSACGLDSSWLYCGYPQVILTRVLSLDRQFEIGLRKNEQEQIIRRLCGALYSMEELSAQLDIRMATPHSLTFAERRDVTGFNLAVHGDLVETSCARTPESKGAIHSVIESLFECRSNVVTRTSLRSIAAFVAVLLVSDCCVELDYMFSFSPPARTNGEMVYSHENRMQPRMTTRLPIALAELTSKGESWPLQFRLDSCNIDARMVEEASLQERMDGLLSFYKGSTQGHSTLNTDVLVSFRNGKTDEDGSVQMDEFIQTLWRQAGLLKPFSQLVHDCSSQNGRKKTGFHKWRSVMALRIVEGLVGLETERCLTLEVEVPGSKELFMGEFPNMLAEAFKSAGLMALCPLLTESVPRRNQESVRMWGPVPVFTVLKYEGEYLQGLERTTDNRGESSAMVRRRNDFRKQKLISALQFVRTYNIELRKINEKLVLAIAEKDREAKSRCLKDRDNLSAKLWSDNTIQDLMIEYLEEIRDSNNQSSATNAQTFDFATRVLEFLIWVRRQTANEGIGAFQWVDGQMKIVSSISKVRDMEGRQLQAARAAFRNEVDLFKKPWRAVGYPDPTVTRDGKKTKKTSVRLASRMLFESGLAFKAVTPPKQGSRGGFQIEKYACLTVGDLYMQYREKSKSVCESSHCMWRLSPDQKILSVLASYCRRSSKEVN